MAPSQSWRRGNGARPRQHRPPAGVIARPPDRRKTRCRAPVSRWTAARRAASLWPQPASLCRRMLPAPRSARPVRDARSPAPRNFDCEFPMAAGPRPNSAQGSRTPTDPHIQPRRTCALIAVRIVDDACGMRGGRVTALGTAHRQELRATWNRDPHLIPSNLDFRESPRLSKRWKLISRVDNLDVRGRTVTPPVPSTLSSTRTHLYGSKT